MPRFYWLFQTLNQTKLPIVCFNGKLNKTNTLFVFFSSISSGGGCTFSKNCCLLLHHRKSLDYFLLHFHNQLGRFLLHLALEMEKEINPDHLLAFASFANLPVDTHYSQYPNLEVVWFIFIHNFDCSAGGLVGFYSLAWLLWGMFVSLEFYYFLPTNWNAYYSNWFIKFGLFISLLLNSYLRSLLNPLLLLLLLLYRVIFESFGYV